MLLPNNIKGLDRAIFGFNPFFLVNILLITSPPARWQITKLLLSFTVGKNLA